MQPGLVLGGQANFLRDNGLDDGLSYDEKDHEKRLAENFPWWKEEEEEEDMDPKELRRLPIEQHNQQTNLWTNQKYPAISAELLALL